LSSQVRENDQELKQKGVTGLERRKGKGKVTKEEERSKNQGRHRDRAPRESHVCKWSEARGLPNQNRQPVLPIRSSTKPGIPAKGKRITAG